MVLHNLYGLKYGITKILLINLMNKKTYDISHKKYQILFNVIHLLINTHKNGNPFK